MKHPLCCQTVTLYRLEGQKIFRQVLTDCFYRYSDQASEHNSISQFNRDFLLITDAPVTLGDRIYDGVGPQISPEQWQLFIPELISGLSQINKVTPYYFGTQLSHYEAGR